VKRSSFHTRHQRTSPTPCGRTVADDEPLALVQRRVWEAQKIVAEQKTRIVVFDPPPLKWSDLKYVFDTQEDHDGEDALQA
jgi:hypothetical protein